LIAHLLRIALTSLTVFSATNLGLAASGGSSWYHCIVKSSSHTGRYTFKISSNPCSVYWYEIETDLKIRDCELPVIAALKPSARDDLSVVWFNMDTGAFYDYLSGVKDRGICKLIADPTK